MPTDQNVILYSQYEMDKETTQSHVDFVNHELDKMEKLFYSKNHKKIKRETVIGVAFSPSPVPRHRIIEPNDKKIILNTKTRYSLADDKKDFPSIFDNEFVFGIRTTQRTLIGRIYKRYRWNNADIIGVIQLIALCSKDDRRIILPSGIHDFLLEYRYELYNEWIKQDKTLTIADFRWITSDTFRWLCEQQGFTHTKACYMSNVMNCFQKHCQKKQWLIDIEEDDDND